MSFWGGFIVHFGIKFIAFYKLIPEAAKHRSLQGKPSLDLPPTLDLIFILYFSFDLFGSVCVCGFGGEGIYLFICFWVPCGLHFVIWISDFSLEALPFVMFWLKIQMSALLTLPGLLLIIL